MKISKTSAFYACFVCGEGVIQGQTELKETNEVILLTSDTIYCLSSDLKQVLWKCKIKELVDFSPPNGNNEIILKNCEELKD